MAYRKPPSLFFECPLRYFLLLKWGFARYPLSTEHITLGSAYSDTAAVTSCSRRSQYAKSWTTTSSSSSYSAPTALGKRLNKLGNITYWTILNVFFIFFLERFLHQTDTIQQWSDNPPADLFGVWITFLCGRLVGRLLDYVTEGKLHSRDSQKAMSYMVDNEVGLTFLWNYFKHTCCWPRVPYRFGTMFYLSCVFFNARRPAIVQFCCVHLSVRRIHSWIVSKPINTVTLYELWIKCKWAVYNKLISANEVLEVSAQRAHIFETS